MKIITHFRLVLSLTEYTSSRSIFVSVPPSSINITGYSEGSRVEIKEHVELSMSCKVSGAKPKPQIVWYKKGIPFTPGKQSYDQYQSFGC